MSELSVGQLKGLTINSNTISVPSGHSVSVSTLKGDSNGTIAIHTGHKLYAPGSVVQVVTATSGFVNQTISSTSPVALSGLSVAITPKFSNSKILIEGVVTASWTYVASLHIYKNGSDMIGNHGGNNQSGGATALWTRWNSAQDLSSNQVWPLPVIYWDSPGTTSPITYDFRANSGWSGGSNSFYLNNRDNLDMLGSSYIKLTEVAQ